MYFDILNRVDLGHDCNGQTDRQTDGRTVRETELP